MSSDQPGPAAEVSLGAATNGAIRDHRVGGARLSPQSSVLTPEDQPQWVANLQLQRLFTLGMFACVAWALSEALVSLGLTRFHAASVAIVAWIVYAAGIALGGRSEMRNLRRYTEYGITDWLLLLVPMLLVLKLLPRLLEGPAALAEEIASWVDNPVRFWDVALVWSLLLVFFVWDESLRQAEALAQLSLQPGELPPAANSPEYHDWMNSPFRFVNHSAAWQRLMWRFVAGGFVMLIFTGLAVVPPQDLGDAERPEVGGVMIHVLLYYLLGLLLAGQTSLDRLRSVWLRGGAAIQPGLARRWLGYGLGLVGIALVIALILPTNFSDENPLGQVPVLGLILLPLRLLFGAVNWLLSHLAALLLAPFTVLVPRTGGGGAGGMPVAPPSSSLPPLEPAGSPPLASRLVFALLLYVLPSALAAYAIWNTWRKRRAIWQGMRSFFKDLWAVLLGAFLDLATLLWRIFSFGSPRLLSLAPGAIQARLRRLRRGAAGSGAPGALGWLRLRGLDPRALIQYFYVSLTQRAEGLGWGRPQGQTAYEYSRELANRLPGQRAEIESLTEAFVRAKYSPRPVGREDARRARTPWERIRGALQTRRRAHQVGGWLGLGR